MTPEERKYKAGAWVLGLLFSLIVWAYVIGFVLRIVEGIAP